MTTVLLPVPAVVTVHHGGETDHDSTAAVSPLLSIDIADVDVVQSCTHEFDCRCIRCCLPRRANGPPLPPSLYSTASSSKLSYNQWIREQRYRRHDPAWQAYHAYHRRSTVKNTKYKDQIDFLRRQVEQCRQRGIASRAKAAALQKLAAQLS